MYVLFTNVFPGGRGKRTESFFSHFTWETSESTFYIIQKFWQKTEKLSKYSKHFSLYKIKWLGKITPGHYVNLFSLDI